MNMQMKTADFMYYYFRVFKNIKSDNPMQRFRKGNEKIMRLKEKQTNKTKK